MIPKFRVWDTVKNAMSEVQAIVYTDERVYPVYSKTIRRFIPFGEVILMRSTGLFDKNGVEIFEGDVVRIGTLEGTPIGAIEFDKSNACFEIPNNKKYVFGGEYVTDFHAKYFEIIGNIYEDAELLESVEE